MLIRRRVVAALMAAQIWPLLARAQRPPWRVGYLGVQSRRDGGRYYDAFVRAMRAHGYVEGKNVTMEWRFADGDYTRLPALAAELVSQKVDVIVASSTPAVSAAQRATASIPIVMGVTGDPIGAGFARSLARPGGNITGTSSPTADYSPKQLEFLKRMLPALSRLGVLLNPGNAANLSIHRSLEGNARKSGIDVIRVEARAAQDIDTAVARVKERAAHALIVLADGVLLQRRREIAELAARHKLPTMYQLREHVEAGGLISYGQNLLHNHEAAAGYVDKILRGARPGELPIEQTSKLELVINAGTARALGISIPKDVLFLADAVVE